MGHLWCLAMTFALAATWLPSEAHEFQDFDTHDSVVPEQGHLSGQSGFHIE